MATKSKNTSLQHTAADRAETVSQERHGASAKSSKTHPLPRTPHERDEAARATGNRSDEKLPPAGREIEQAHDDIERGLADTDRRGVPDDVPSSRDNRAR